jgi:hypothetical protein
MPPETTYTPAPPPAPAPAKMLPGFSELYKAGKAIYQERLHTFLKIGAVFFVIEFLLTWLSPKRGETHTMEQSLNAVPPMEHSFGAGLAVGVLVILVLYISFALYIVIAGRAQDLSGKTALRMAGQKFLSYLWIIILSALAVLGINLVIVGIPFLILMLVAVFALHAAPIAMIIFSALAALAFIGVTVFVGVHLSFATWLLAEGKQKGVAALRASRDLVQGRFWAIFCRFVFVSIITGLIYIPAVIVLVVVGLTGGTVGVWISNLITSAYSAFLIVPFTLAMKYTIYDRARG